MLKLILLASHTMRTGWRLRAAMANADCRSFVIACDARWTLDCWICWEILPTDSMPRMLAITITVRISMNVTPARMRARWPGRGLRSLVLRRGAVLRRLGRIIATRTLADA